MSEIKCDLCGGNIAIADGGKAKCQNCGMEYTAERLREKMQVSTQTTSEERRKTYAISQKQTKEDHVDVNTQKRIMAKYIETQDLALKANLKSAVMRKNGIPFVIFMFIDLQFLGAGVIINCESFDPLWFFVALLSAIALIVMPIMFFKHMKDPQKWQNKYREKYPDKGWFWKASSNIEFGRKQDLLQADIQALNRGEYYVRCKYCEHKIPIKSDEGSFNCPQCGNINRY